MFINTTLDFIKNSDLPLLQPDIRTVTLNEDDTHTVSMSFSDSLNKNKLKSNYIIAQTVVFILLDTLIDMKAPSLERLSFKKRYQLLPLNDNFDLILKETYRIFKIIRNSLTHNRTSTIISNDDINISYRNNSTDFKLICSSKTIQFLNSIVVLLSTNRDNMSLYSLALAEAYYNEMISSIVEFTDDCGPASSRINQRVPFKWRVRYRVTNPIYSILSGELHIKEYVLDHNELYAGSEYVINLNDKAYLVPNEALRSGGIIHLNDIEKWLART